jgi:hypothetical protein
MEKEIAPPQQSEDKNSVDMDKETAPQKADKKSVDVATSSLEEPTKSPDKVGDDEKNEDEYPKGLTLFFIMLGLNLAVFLIAIGRSAFHSHAKVDFQADVH